MKQFLATTEDSTPFGPKRSLQSDRWRLSDASQWVVSADEAQLGSWLAAFQAAVPTDGKLTGRQARQILFSQRFGLLLTVTATECLTRRSSVSPCTPSSTNWRATTCPVFCPPTSSRPPTDPGGALWGLSSALSARTKRKKEQEEQEVAKVLR